MVSCRIYDLYWIVITTESMCRREELDWSILVSRYNKMANRIRLTINEALHLDAMSTAEARELKDAVRNIEANAIRHYGWPAALLRRL